jgi:hypothetical protein
MSTRWKLAEGSSVSSGVWRVLVFVKRGVLWKGKTVARAWEVRRWQRVVGKSRSGM